MECSCVTGRENLSKQYHFIFLNGPFFALLYLSMAMVDETFFPRPAFSHASKDFKVHVFFSNHSK